MALKNQVAIVCAIVVMSVALGMSVRPHEPQEFVTIEPHQIAFLVSLESRKGEHIQITSVAGADTLGVDTRRVEIPHRWVSTGWLPKQGYWKPTVAIITIDRTPVTLRWHSETDASKVDPKNRDSKSLFRRPSLVVESQDRQAFVMSLAGTVRITDASAAGYLRHYPSNTLEQVLQNEVATFVETYLTEQSLRYTGLELEQRQSELMASTEAALACHFADRGIIIDHFGAIAAITASTPSAAPRPMR
ncbi:MAG: hypothetical protein R3E01_19065 [Pirellulaceae bacterium]|nr:hypothetical protein [Planctomycetales bacterium]